MSNTSKAVESGFGDRLNFRSASGRWGIPNLSSAPYPSPQTKAGRYTWSLQLPEAQVVTRPLLPHYSIQVKPTITVSGADVALDFISPHDRHMPGDALCSVRTCPVPH